MTGAGKRVAIVGGSIGGLTAALLLRDLGFSVDVYERTPGELDGRGGGIVLQPETLRWFTERSTLRPDALSTKSRFMRVIGEGDQIEFEEPVEWRFTSWGALYGALLSDFGREHYHYGHFCVGVDQHPDSATLRFTNGVSVEADLVIFADGITSLGRKKMLPDEKIEYVGYVGWRGTVPELELTDHTRSLLGDSVAYSFGDQTHICMYPIPGNGGAVEHGKRLLNYVWYRNIPHPADLDEVMTDKSGFRGEVSLHPGRVQERYIEEMKFSADTLSPAAAELVRATSEPYLQPIMDFRPSRMVFGRVITIGDAAFVARPHAAAGTAKAAEEAWRLAAAIEKSGGDIDAALVAWESVQLTIGNRLIDRIEHMGRSAQIDNSWSPHDQSLRFGLLEGALNPAY